jgi:D-serine deaminase-like pyridoxal phosphate-dependent protein
MMAPQLAARQLAAGAWGISVATIEQLQAYRAYGFPRLLLANELVDRPGIAWLAAELDADPGFEAYCYVDSTEGVALLDQILAATGGGRPLPVLVEVGFPGGRTGARTDTEARAVARAVAATTTLRLAGVAGYEGGLGHDADPAVLEAVAAFCAGLRHLLQGLQDRGLATGPQILTAGGSAFFDVVVAELTGHWEGRERPTVIIRSGAYITHDHGFYAGISPATRHAAGPLSLVPALEVWASVISRPEPDLALLAAGRRDVPFDIDLPFVVKVRHADGTAGEPAGMEITNLNDQHAYLRLPASSRLAPGDVIGLGISHPCTAFDKWRVIPLIDEGDRVIDAVHTFF